MAGQELITITQPREVYLPVQEMFLALENADSEIALRTRKNEEDMTRLFQQMQATIEELITKSKNLEIELESTKSRYSEANRIHEAEVLALNNELTTARNESQSYNALNQQLSEAHQQQVTQQEAQFNETKNNVKQAINYWNEGIKDKAQREIDGRQQAIAQIAGVKGHRSEIRREMWGETIPHFNEIKTFGDQITNILNNY